MSDMVQKLEHDVPNKNIAGARCDLQWFRENMVQPVKELAADKHGPTILEIHRLIAKRVEIWYRISTGKNPVFEKKAEYPLLTEITYDSEGHHAKE